MLLKFDNQRIVSIKDYILESHAEIVASENYQASLKYSRILLKYTLEKL